MSSTTTFLTDEDFSEIPVGWQVPGSYTEIKPLQSGQGITAFPVRALIIGHLGFLATATAAVPYTIYGGLAQAAELLGDTGSAYEAFAAFYAGAPTIPVDVIGINDTPANMPQAAWSVALGGAPTQAATACLLINGKRYPFAADPATNIAAWSANLAASVNSIAPPHSVNAAVTNGVVVVTAFRAGADANDIDVRASPLATDQVAGLTIAVTQTGVSPSNPSIAPAIAAVSATWYTDIVLCFSDAVNLGLMAVEAARRYQALSKLDCRVTYGLRGTYGQLLTISKTLNSQFMQAVGAQNPLWAPWVAAAAWAAAQAFALNQDPARQLRTLVMPALAGLAPIGDDLFDDAERNVLLGSGLSTFTVEQDGTVEIERAVTNYQVSAAGYPDVSWQDVMTAAVMTRIRFDWDAYVELTYPRSKLALDGTIAAQYASNVVTPSLLKNSWTGRAKLYEQLGWIQNSTVTSAQAIFAIDPSNDNRCNGQQPLQIMGNLMLLANSLQFEV